MNKGNFYDLPEKYKYSVVFASEIKSATKEETDKYISLASAEDLKKHLPKNIDFNEKVDCLAVAGQAFNVNKLNLNDDGVDNETAARLVDLFPLSYIDKFHHRQDIVGCILNASFVDSTTNKEITKEEALTYNQPYTCVIGGIIWKLADRKLSEAIEESSNKESQFYGKLFFSWELGFSDYRLIEMPKGETDFSKGTLISSAEKVKEYDKRLRANEGSGQLDNGNKIGRIIVGDCIPLGVGIVENPAGQLAPIISNAEKIDNNECTCAEHYTNKCSCGNMISSCSCEAENKKINIINDGCPDCKDKAEKSNKISQSKKISVIASEENQNIKIMEKITDIKQITDETLKQTNASVITNFIEEEARKANQKFLDEQSKSKQAETTLAETQKTLDKVKNDLEELNKKVEAQEAEATFNQRMSYFDGKYELNSEERKAIANEIKDMDEDSFSKAKDKYDIFLKDKDKEVLAAKKKATDDKKKNMDDGDSEDKKDGGADEDTEDKNGKKKKQSKASLENPTEVVDNALENGKETTPIVPNATSPEVSFADKFAEAFDIKNCIEIRK